MPKYNVTVSKGEANYIIEADDEEDALEQAEEMYDQRDFEIDEVKKIEKIKK